MAEKYELRRFRAVEKDSPDYELGTAWLRGVGIGFYDEPRKDDFVDKIMAMYLVDNREMTGVYQSDGVAAHSLAADVPVATFATLRKDLNIGYGRQLEAQLVTAVTVRGTHRRQGLLRRMMTGDLAAAKADGVALAALTASEASIYGRFGYGVATFERSIKVDTGPRFRLRHEPSGSVEIADRKVLLELAPEVFGRVHSAMPGSISRQEAYRLRSSGMLGRDGSEDEAIRCALHYDAAGTVDGYVSYKFAGWETKPYTMEIVDLVAATDAAYLELWQFLGSIDLVERISWQDAPVDDPLTWALEDPALRRVLGPAGHAVAARPGPGAGAGRPALLGRRDPGSRRAGQSGLRRRHLRPDGQRGRGHGDAGSGGRAGPVTGCRGPRLHLSGRRLSRDPESRRPDHRARSRGGADGATHVRRRTLTALPHALLAVRPAGRGVAGAVPMCKDRCSRGAKRPGALTRVHVND